MATYEEHGEILRQRFVAALDALCREAAEKEEK